MSALLASNSNNYVFVDCDNFQISDSMLSNSDSKEFSDLFGVDHDSTTYLLVCQHSDLRCRSYMQACLRNRRVHIDKIPGKEGHEVVDFEIARLVLELVGASVAQGLNNNITVTIASSDTDFQRIASSAANVGVRVRLLIQGLPPSVPRALLGRFDMAIALTPAQVRDRGVEPPSTYKVEDSVGLSLVEGKQTATSGTTSNKPPAENLQVDVKDDSSDSSSPRDWNLGSPTYGLKISATKKRKQERESVQGTVDNDVGKTKETTTVDYAAEHLSDYKAVIKASMAHMAAMKCEFDRYDHLPSSNDHDTVMAVVDPVIGKITKPITRRMSPTEKILNGMVGQWQNGRRLPRHDTGQVITWIEHSVMTHIVQSVYPIVGGKKTRKSHTQRIVVDLMRAGHVIVASHGVIEGRSVAHVHDDLFEALSRSSNLPIYSISSDKYSMFYDGGKT